MATVTQEMAAYVNGGVVVNLTYDTATNALSSCTITVAPFLSGSATVTNTQTGASFTVSAPPSPSGTTRTVNINGVKMTDAWALSTQSP